MAPRMPSTDIVSASRSVLVECRCANQNRAANCDCSERWVDGEAQCHEDWHPGQVEECRDSAAGNEIADARDVTEGADRVGGRLG